MAAPRRNYEIYKNKSQFLTEFSFICLNNLKICWEQTFFKNSYLFCRPFDPAARSGNTNRPIHDTPNRQTYIQYTGIHRQCCCRLFVCFFGTTAPPMGQGLLIHEVSRSYTTTHHSPTSDQLVAETSTSQQTTLITDKHPCFWWYSNPQSQQARGRRPTP